MKINGMVHCMFEQSGTFKKEFEKLGICAEDYDIQNEFGETDHIVDLFSEIDNAYDGKDSLFDGISQDDLIIAFFPCIYFTCQKLGDFMLNKHGMEHTPLHHRVEYALDQLEKRTRFHTLLYKLIGVADMRGLRLVIENPWNVSYLMHNLMKPAVIDMNRMRRGDYFIKPTAYWFVNCEPTHGFTHQNDKEIKRVMDCKGSKVAGVCSEERSMISPDYARNWICDFVLGKVQDIDPTLFGDCK